MLLCHLLITNINLLYGKQPIITYIFQVTFYLIKLLSERGGVAVMWKGGMEGVREVDLFKIEVFCNI